MVYLLVNEDVGAARVYTRDVQLFGCPAARAAPAAE